MAATVRKRYLISAVDATTVTMAPIVGERKGDPVDPTGVVMTFVATPTGTYKVNRVIELRLEAR